MRAAVLVFLLAAAGLQAAEIHLEADGLGEGARAFAFEAGREPVEAEIADGVFKFTQLVPGTYNIEIRAGKLDIIGVDLRLRDAEGNVTEVAEVSKAVEKSIREFFEHTEDFFDRRRMPLVAGTADRAVALVENIRSGDTTTDGSASAKVLFRLDLWEFRKSFGSWHKTESSVFLRRFFAAGEFEAKRFVYTGELGAIDLAAKEVRRIEFQYDGNFEVKK